LRNLKREAQIGGEAFCYKEVDGQRSVAPVKEWKAFFEGVPEAEVSHS
jgi:hypothetical protein